MFVNRMPRYEILSEDAIELLDRGWRRIVSEIGIEFTLDEAAEEFRRAGQTVEGSLVRLDPDFILEQVAKAPHEFDIQARNPERNIHVGGDHMVFASVYGPPFVREGSVRRDATMADFENFVRLSQAFDALEAPTASLSIINVNSPLRYDDRMLSAMLEYVRARQAVMITPFLLMGAMSPVAIPATLAQQLAEALSGIALAQLVRPGTPVVMGSFLSNTDMQSGSPSFGTPESGIGLLCSGQLARRYGLPWRSGGGGLTSSQTVDAQSAYEALMTMLPTFLSGANFVMHSAGWLEGGLVSCYEKFIVDIELLRMLEHEFKPLEVTEESLAFDAHEEVGAGGHFLGAMHTLERFRECFYRPLLSSTENFDRWSRNGGRGATERAGEIWRKTVEEYEQPPIDAAVDEQLREYVTLRRAELGD